LVVTDSSQMESQDIHVANTAGFFADLLKETQTFRFAICGQGKRAIERFETPDASAEFANGFWCESLRASFQRLAELANAGLDFRSVDGH